MPLDNGAVRTAVTIRDVAREAGVHPGQLGLGRRELLVGLVVLLADPVELRGQLVDLGLDLAHGRLRGRARDPAVGEPARHDQPGHQRGTPTNPGNPS